jgi:hypothetical protein
MFKLSIWTSYTSSSRVAHLAWLNKLKSNTRLDSLDTEFKSSRAESQVTRLARKFRVLILAQ